MNLSLEISSSKFNLWLDNKLISVENNHAVHNGCVINPVKIRDCLKSFLDETKVNLDKDILSLDLIVLDKYYCLTPIRNLIKSLELCSVKVNRLIRKSTILRNGYPNHGVVIDIGADLSKLYVFKGGKLAHYYQLSLAGNVITYDIMKYYEIAFDEAERRKINSLDNPTKLRNIINQRLEEILELLILSIPLELQSFIGNCDISCIGGTSKILGFNETVNLQIQKLHTH